MNTAITYLFAYGLGVFSAIGALLLGRYLGRRNAPHDMSRPVK